MLCVCVLVIKVNKYCTFSDVIPPTQKPSENKMLQNEHNNRSILYSRVSHNYLYIFSCQTKKSKLASRNSKDSKVQQKQQQNAELILTPSIRFESVKYLRMLLINRPEYDIATSNFSLSIFFMFGSTRSHFKSGIIDVMFFQLMFTKSKLESRKL